MWNKKKQLMWIPEELQYEILLRLQVKSLLKFKSVCKSWRTIISNPSFAKFHLQRNNSSSSRLLVGFGDEMHSICYDLLESSLSTKEIEYSASRMRCSFKKDIRNITLLGSCNGLVLLWHTDYSEDSENDDYYIGIDGDDFFCIWNPATGDYMKIESPYTYFPYCQMCIYGLGYDSKKEDYKFVTGMCFDESKLSTEVKVFSLRSDSWEIIQTPYGFTNDCKKLGILVNGDLHWLAKGERGLCIVYLDSSSDIPLLHEIQLPSMPDLKFISVGVLGEGRLCALVDNGYPVGLSRVEVWEMQVYRVPESWTKRYVISNETITKKFIKKYSCLKILWSFENIVFLDTRYLVLYDPKHETATERQSYWLLNFTSEVNYVESLLSLNSGIFGTGELEESPKTKHKEREKEEKTA